MSKSRIICSVVLVLAFIVLFLDNSDDDDMSKIDFSSVISSGSVSPASQSTPVRPGSSAVLAIPPSLIPVVRTEAIRKNTVPRVTNAPVGSRKNDLFTASQSFVQAVIDQTDPQVEPKKRPHSVPEVSMTFRLSAILVGKTTRIAMINNQPITPGGTLGPFTLVEVKTASALLKDEHRQFELEINAPRTEWR